MINQRRSDLRFLTASALLFAATAACTINWCTSMSTMRGMRMPGGWTMSMTWMRTPGQSWLAAAASFIGMWLVMMVAMMLPSLVPTLQRYRKAVGPPDMSRVNLLTIVVGAGYFFVWTIAGAPIFPLGGALATVAMQRPPLARAVPIMGAIIVLIAGALQFTRWKADRLACCRDAGDGGTHLPARATTAWRHGLRLGVQCVSCCCDLTAVLIVAGIMDVRVMGLITAAITAERAGPAGTRVARAIGVVVVATGCFLIASTVRT